MRLEIVNVILHVRHVKLKEIILVDIMCVLVKNVEWEGILLNDLC